MLLVFLVVVVFVLPSLGEFGVAGRLLTSVFFSFILISGVATVAHSARTTALVGGLVLTTLAVRWLRLSFGSESLALPDALVSALFCIILAFVVLAQVFRQGPITFQRIQGAVAAYLLFGLAWAFAYQLVALHWPQAFAPSLSASPNPNADLMSHFVYFSFVTLTTLGYGDITAVHPLARSLVTMEALTGQLFPTILLARLVSMELYHRHAQDREQ